MLRAAASRCRRLPSSRGGPRPAPRSWVTPARDFVVSAPQESSSASPSASPAPAALQPPRGSLRPAILVCTSKVVSAATRADYEAWLVDGKRLIEEVLRDKDCQAGLAVGAGADVQHRFSWVHFPAPSSVRSRGARELKTSAAAASASMSHVRHSGAPECETVAVVFQRHDDLERWRHSRRRAAWLERGERFGDDGDGETPFEKKNGRVVMSARASTIDVDDGSLGGWLPADAFFGRVFAAFVREFAVAARRVEGVPGGSARAVPAGRTQRAVPVAADGRRRFSSRRLRAVAATGADARAEPGRRFS